MSNSNRTAGRNRRGAMAAVAVLFVAARPDRAPARAAGACALVPNDKTPSEKMLQCGRRPDGSGRSRRSLSPLYKKGDPLPVGIRLNDGALLIEYHPARPQEKFQILTPLAIAAVRGTKWAMDVTKARTSTLVLDGAVAVTNRRLNQYRRPYAGAGRRHHADRHVHGPENVGRGQGPGASFPFRRVNGD